MLPNFNNLNNDQWKLDNMTLLFRVGVAKALETEGKNCLL